MNFGEPTVFTSEQSNVPFSCCPLYRLLMVGAKFIGEACILDWLATLLGSCREYSIHYLH